MCHRTYTYFACQHVLSPPPTRCAAYLRAEQDYSSSPSSSSSGLCTLINTTCMPSPPPCVLHTTRSRISRDCDKCLSRRKRGELVRSDTHHHHHHHRHRRSSHDRNVRRDRSRRHVDDGGNGDRGDGNASGLTADMLEVPAAVYMPGGPAGRATGWTTAEMEMENMYGGLSGGYYGIMPPDNTPYTSEENMSAVGRRKASESDIERAVSPLNDEDRAAAWVPIPTYDEYAHYRV